ncbi:thiol reductant ABC exporter subunit CydD [Bacillaceae bacterium Marseille-Q3522]|nr:thiol reductant ABC exporter subunit CydD [Bacillaceae bacterium Marseille-Q3522]
MDKHLFHYKGSKLLFFLTGVMTTLQAVALMGQALFLAKAITQLFSGGKWQSALPLFFYFAGFFVFRHLLQLGKERLAFHFAEKTASGMQNKLLQSLFQLGPRTVGKQGSGNMITLCLEGIPQFKTYLQLFIPRSVSMVVIPLLLLIYVFSVDLLSGIVLAVTMPIMIAFLILLGFVARHQITAQFDTYRLLSRHFVDSLRGLVTLKFLGKSKQHKEAIAEVSNKYRIATNRTLRIAFLSTFSLDFFSSLSIAVVAVELGIRLIDGMIALEPALIALILAPEFYLPIRELGNDYHATMDGKEAGENIHQFLAAAENIPSAANATLPRWNEKTVLTIKNLKKKADEENRLLLKNICFSVTGFQKVGIIGFSGAGKSTLIDILSGFTRPSNGDISINETKLPDFTSPDWHQQVTYIPQHPYIFSGTVAENIAFYEPDATSAKIEEAAEITGLTAFINSLPNGFDERIGQGGRTLSGGEEQRIALARSVLQNRPIMLFDEPTAHLDIETEHEIKQLMLPLMEKKLVFFATHRLHWMQQMDIIFVLAHGKITEAGTHQQLYDKKGVYYDLIQAQIGGVKK